MSEDKEKNIKVELSITMDVKGIEHNLAIDVDGYTKKQNEAIDDVIRDGTDYLVESMRRQLTKV